MYSVPNPHSRLGQVIDNGHCVRLVQVVAQAPHTSTWKQGPKVRGNNVQFGTVIATFDQNGRYENDTTGRSHAAIFLSETNEGLRVIDQWQKQPVHERLIRFRGGQGSPINDGDAFYVLIT